MKDDYSDSRVALNGSLLAHGLSVPLNILSQIGAGTSSLVYNVECEGRQYILKQLYPLGLTLSHRLRIQGQRITAEKNWISRIAWAKTRISFLRAGHLQTSFKSNNALYPYITRVLHRFSAYGTLFILSESVHGQAWDTLLDETAEEILAIALKISELTSEMHRAGWLMIDVKASNYVISYDEHTPHVYLIDFDRLIRRFGSKHRKRYYCSNETAPPELLRPERKHVGIHSDVFSIASMLSLKLGGLDRQAPPSVLYPRIASRLGGWPENRKRILFSLFDDAISDASTRKIRDCDELSFRLKQIIDFQED